MVQICLKVFEEISFHNKNEQGVKSLTRFLLLCQALWNSIGLPHSCSIVLWVFLKYASDGIASVFPVLHVPICISWHICLPIVMQCLQGPMLFAALISTETRRVSNGITLSSPLHYAPTDKGPWSNNLLIKEIVHNFVLIPK